MNRFLPPELYLVTDRHQTRGRPLLEVVRDALEAGVRAVQLRERDLSTRDLLDLAGRMKNLTDRFGAALYINDRIDVCLAVGAIGVHLRSRHWPIPAVRKVIGPDRAIGVSCHNMSELLDSEKGGADFAVLGPIFDTPSKRALGAPLGTEILTQARAVVGIPILAIGGIQTDRVAPVIHAGAAGVAVISAVLAARDVRAVVTEFLSALAAGDPRGVAIDRIESR